MSVKNFKLCRKKLRYCGYFNLLRNFRQRKKNLSKFKKFYSELENKHNIFYMFFTRNLLFWVNKSVKFIPDSVNVVLIGAGLDEDELIWLKNNVNRPFYHIDVYCDDNTVWEYLVRTNLYNFGWIDADCFVLNPRLFDEMIKIDNNVAVNCVWSYKCKFNPELNILNSYFLFINVEVMKAIKSKGKNILPYPYVYRPNKYVVTNHRIITSDHAKHIRQLLPKGTYPESKDSITEGPYFFDTLVLYQIIANSMGYKLNRIRSLDPVNYYSDEAIHIGASSQILDMLLSGRVSIIFSKTYKVAFQIIYLLISQMGNSIPVNYLMFKKLILKKLIELDTNRDQIIQDISAFLTDNGLSQDAVIKFLNIDSEH